MNNKKMRGIILVLIVGTSFLFSCSSLRTAVDNQDRVMIDESNFKLLEGEYSGRSISDDGEYRLINFILGSSYKLFKEGNTCDSCSIQFKVVDKKTLSVSYINYGQTKTAKIKGKFKNGYFVVKRSSMFIPLIVVNVFRNRQLRIGLLNNGNLITDHNEINIPTILVIPAHNTNKKNFNVEFEKRKEKRNIN